MRCLFSPSSSASFFNIDIGQKGLRCDAMRGTFAALYRAAATPWALVDNPQRLREPWVFVPGAGLVVPAGNRGDRRPAQSSVVH